MNNVSSCSYLSFQIVDRARRNLIKKLVGKQWLCVQKFLRNGKCLAPLSFYHVCKYGPWSSCKPDQWHAAVQPLLGECNGIHHILQIVGYGNMQAVNIFFC